MLSQQSCRTAPPMAPCAVRYPRRREGIKYNANALFMDIIENVNVLMNNKGQVLQAEVRGRIVIKCYLSGMPDIVAGLANSRLDDVKFHQCVNLGRYHTEQVTASERGLLYGLPCAHAAVSLHPGKVHRHKPPSSRPPRIAFHFLASQEIAFTPPDGEFTLMTYRCSEGITPPFVAVPTIKEVGGSRMEIMIKLKGDFDPKVCVCTW